MQTINTIVIEYTSILIYSESDIEIVLMNLNNAINNTIKINDIVNATNGIPLLDIVNVVALSCI